LNIICALINVYQKTENIDKANEDRWATQMLMLRGRENELQKFLERIENVEKEPQWKKCDAEMLCFTILDKEYVKNICFGNFPLTYIEHIHQHPYQ
jgi:hypothetical protein